jgi:hypothetical protein
MSHVSAPPSYQTTVRRALAAIGVVSLTLTVLYVAGVIAFMAGRPPQRDNPLIIMLPVSALTVAGGCATAMGLLSPIWWWLDRRGFRRWPAGVLAGALPAGLAGAAWAIATFQDVIASGRGAAGAVGVVFFTLIGAAVGAALGGIGWRVAYRRVPDAPGAAQASEP